MPNKIAKKIISRNKFYYGWIILAISSLGFFFSSPGQTYFISAFIDSYIKEFNWNRSTISSLYSLATLAAGILLFLIGRLGDRFGQKKIIIVVAGLLGVSCMWNSFILTQWMLFIGFFLGRLCGQGSMILLPSTIVPRWFLKKRALAFSLLSMGTVIGSAVIPPFNTWLIDIWGWNYVWKFWAVLLWFFFIPITYTFLFNRPENLGLYPDNSRAGGLENISSSLINEHVESWTLKEALHTHSFWGMLFCQIIIPMISTGIVFHFVSILGTKGLSAASASFVLSLLAIVSFPTTFIAGFLLDKIKLQYATAFICVLEFIGLIVLLFSTSIYTAVIFAVFHGTASGIQSVCGGIVWPNYYGMNHLGSIRGLVMTVTVVASALGPIPFGIIFDLTGTYTLAIVLMMFLPVIGFLFALLSSKPQKKKLNININ